MMGKLSGEAARIARPLWKLVVAVAVAVVLFIIIQNGIKNPVSGESEGYTARFTDASGLHANADVRIRGVKAGKVTDVSLHQKDGGATADVKFTLVKPHRLTADTKVAVKYANLAGVRYLDVTEVDGDGPAVRNLPTAQTIPSFDITQLFNGLQPVLETLSPQEINTFSSNALTLLQGDGAGLAPMLDSVNRLSRYAVDREKVISTLVENLSRISDSLGGKSPQIIEFMHDIQSPIDSAMTVLDQFQKGDQYGPAFMGTLNSVLSGLGIDPDTAVDQALSQAFPSIDNMWKALGLLPTVSAGLQQPAAVSSVKNECPQGRLSLPALGQVLVNGSGVILCKG